MFYHAIWHTEMYFIGIRHPEVFHKKVVLENFVKFTEADTCNFVKKRLWHRCFLVNFELEEILRTLFPQNTSCRLLPVKHSFMCNFIKKRPWYTTAGTGVFL